MNYNIKRNCGVFPSNLYPLLEKLFMTLKSLDYVGRVKTIQDFINAFEKNDMNTLFFDLITWLSSQLGKLLRLEGRIDVDFEEALRTASLQETLSNPIAFLIEVYMLLKVLRCTLKELVTGRMEKNLLLPQNQLLLIKYLIQKLKAAKNLAVKKPKKKKQIKIVDLEESFIAKELRELIMALKFSKPPDDLQTTCMFTEIDKRICTLSHPLLPEDIVSNMLFTGALTESQWFSLERLYGEFYAEFRNRRELNITGAYLSISFFLWKSKIERINNMTNNQDDFRQRATVDPDVQISDVIAATADMSIGEKVSLGACCQSTGGVAHQVTMCQVPDRGGRPNEQKPPSPEVPSWQPRKDPQNKERSPFTISTSRSQDEMYVHGRDIQGCGDPQTHLLPTRAVEVTAPRPIAGPMPIAGDNFAQFGNVPIVMEQQSMQGAPGFMRMNPNVHVAPIPRVNFQQGWGIPQGGRGSFSGRGAFPFSLHSAHGNADCMPYGVFEGHANVDRGAYGGHANADRGAHGGLNRGQYDNSGYQGRGGRGRQVRRVQYGGGRRNLDGFGGARGYGGYGN